MPAISGIRQLCFVAIVAKLAIPGRGCFWPTTVLCRSVSIMCTRQRGMAGAGHKTSGRRSKCRRAPGTSTALAFALTPARMKKAFSATHNGLPFSGPVPFAGQGHYSSSRAKPGACVAEAERNGDCVSSQCAIAAFGRGRHLRACPVLAMALLQRDAERARLMCPDPGNPLSARRFRRMAAAAATS
jgi:hypothetical protein